MVLISLKTTNLAPYFFPASLASWSIAADVARSDGDFLANFKAPLQDSAASNTTSKSFCVLSGLIDVEASNNNHVGWHIELTRGNWDSAKVVYNDIDVISQLGWNRDDWGWSAIPARKTFFDFFVLLLDVVLIFDYDIDFVLEHNDMFELHDIDCNQMLARLRLGVGLVTSDQEKRCIHDCSASKHSCHEGIVAGAVNETNMAGEYHFRLASLVRTFHIIRLGWTVGLIAVRGLASWALKKLSVCVAQLDGDVTEFLTEVADGLKSIIKEYLHSFQIPHARGLICRVRHGR